MIELTPIGTVESPLTDPASAPKQGDEGAPDAWLAFEPAVLEALDGIRPGDEIIVLTCDGGRVRVRNLEAVDGTPIVYVKPVLSGDAGEL